MWLWFAIVGFVLIGISLPLMFRKVPPNRFYGLRVSATLADRQVWYEANAASARDTALVGAITAAIAILFGILKLETSLTTLVCVGSVVIGSIVAAVRGLKIANRAFKERQRNVSR